MKFTFLKRSKNSTIKGDVIKSAIITPQDAEILRRHKEGNKGGNTHKVRMYDAAVFDNLTADFPASINSANAEIFNSIQVARPRARTLCRDNPYARAILSTFQNNVGGHEPFRLEVKLGKYSPSGEFIEEKETNRMIETEWIKSGRPENCTVSKTMSRQEVYLQAISAVIRDGGILARHWPLFPNNPYRYAIEPIEIDRLDSNYNAPSTNNNSKEILFSIEMDEWKAPVAYYILTRHPGDVFAYSNSPRYRERVESKDIIALFDIRDRAGQLVGVPRFISVIKRLWRENQFDVAHCSAAIKSAATPIYLTKTMPTAQDYVTDHIRSTIEGAIQDEFEGEKYDDVEPGVMRELPYGYDATNVDPKFPIENATGFKKDQLRAAGAGSGVPYHILANDLAEANFSSARIGGIEFQETCKVLQSHIIQNYCHPWFNNWVACAIMAGKINIPITRLEEIQDAARFRGKRWPYLQPEQDAKAASLRISTGLTSRDAEIKETDEGESAESVDAQNAADKKSAEAHGLDYTPVDEQPQKEPEGEGGTPAKKTSTP